MKPASSLLSGFAALALALSSPSPSGAQSVGDVDAVTSHALRAALLGNSDEVLRLARDRSEVEKEGGGPEVADQLAALAAAVRRPAPDKPEVRDALSGIEWSRDTRAFVELVERTNAEERWRSARSSRRYENRRRLLNSFTNAASGVLSLQIFPLLQPPLDLAEYLAIDRHVLNPEERRELYTARVFVDQARGRPNSGAARSVDRLTNRRVELARMQARRNAERAVELDRLRTADWWYRREMALAGRGQPFRDDHIALLEEMAARGARTAESVTVLPGEELIAPSSMFAAYSRLVGKFIQNPRGSETLAQARNFLGRYPASAAADDARFLEAVWASANGQPDLARVTMRYIAENDTTSAWSVRSSAYLRRPRFNPEYSLQQAADKIHHRRVDFILYGSDPGLGARHLSPEAARLESGSLVASARSLFILDVLGRILVYPLLPPSLFPRQELFEAVETTPDRYFDTVEGAGWMERAARAYASQKRYGDAARAWERAGRPDKAARARDRHVRRRLEVLEQVANPARREAELLELRDEFPGTRNQGELDEAIVSAGLDTRRVALLSREELRSLVQMWGEEALIDPAMVDGDRNNGEVGRDGMRLLEGGEVVWTERGSGVQQTQQIGTEKLSALLQQALPVRRELAVKRVLDEPEERKRIPIAVEGGVGPGFDVSPGLVPLEVDRRERRLYE